MWHCGNDGPEIDANHEIKQVVVEVRDQLVAKLGRAVTKVCSDERKNPDLQPKELLHQIEC